LAEEVQALDEARHALSQNEPNEALRLLGQYGHRFPKQRLAHEATFLRIQALMAQGDQLGARAAAESFIRTNPSSPLVPRLQALFGQ
jgi:outer membrane protein assembly factor BamD (BamD/ComL family)